MKVVTILGTRPEIIRLSRVIEFLDGLCDQRLIHTGQNHDPNLSDIFFRELRVREPDYRMGAVGTFGEQVATIMRESERILALERPDRFLVLGDTNSSLAALMAKRMGIPVYHMEAGNRCHDDRVPEEVNRRVIDHCSDILMPYTQRSKENLVREGIEEQRIHVTGNPIYEVMQANRTEIDGSRALRTYAVSSGSYFLVTMHRAENVDDRGRLSSLLSALAGLCREHGAPVLCSLHPRTRKRMDQFGLAVPQEDIRFVEPLGFVDFVKLEENALCVVSDSGTVQEECCILRVPNVTIRDTTERPETMDAGSNVLSGVELESILRCVRTVLARPPNWTPPSEYLASNVSQTVARIVLGYHHAF